MDMSQNFTDSHHSILCPLCNATTSLITDQETIETICINCGGIITNDELQDLHQYPSFFSNKAQENFLVKDDDTGSKLSESFLTTLASQDRGLYTIIGETIKDASGQCIDIQMRNIMNRLRIWDTRSQIRNNKERNLLTALTYLQRLKYELGLPNSVIEKAAYIYRKMLEKDLIKKTTITTAITVASYIACRELKIPRTLDELALISNTDKKILMKFYRYVILELDIKIPQLDLLKMIVKIANICKISEKTKRYALIILNELIEKNLFASKNPYGLAGAIIYFACKRNDEHIIQYKIANATGVTIIAIRNSFKFITDHLK
jgi:transcription initiation factor TFIIB